MVLYALFNADDEIDQKLLAAYEPLGIVPGCAFDASKVGENAGMMLDDDGDIAIHIAAERPEGVPDENWLPLVRGD